MELKIWVEGIQRVVCGVTDSTTCQDVVIALAHATGKTGRFSLLEKWRESERLIAPTECPLRVLHKWGEYANDVHFVLRHSEGKSRRDSTGKDGDKFLHDFTPHLENRPPSVKRNLTFSGAHSYNSYPLSAKTARKVAPQEDASMAESPPPECSSPISASSRSSSSPSASRTSPRKARASASVSPYSSLERKKVGQPTRSASPYYHSPKDSSVVSSQGRTYSTQSVPLFTVQSQQPGGQQDTKESDNDETDGVDRSEEKDAGDDDVSRGDLVKLVNLQLERLDVQKSQMKMLDAEIAFWEHREQEQDKQDQSIKEKFEELMATESEIDNELEELEIVSWVDKLEMERQRHQRLLSELSVLRGKVSDVEQAIAQQHTDTTSLNKELEEEEKAATKKEQELKEQEIRVLQEISELQKHINTNLMQHENNQTSIDGLQNDVKKLESAILEKKTQIAGLERDLKEANMDDFVQTPTSWLITPGEGSGFCRSASSRPGSARRMTQSPQRLKEVTPTARNPQGLWV